MLDLDFQGAQQFPNNFFEPTNPRHRISSKAISNKRYNNNTFIDSREGILKEFDHQAGPSAQPTPLATYF